MADDLLLLVEGTGTDHLLLQTGDDLLLQSSGAATVTGTMTADLGGLTATIVGTRVVTGTLVATFGPLSATMVGAVTHVISGVMVASFGGLTATIYAVPFDPAATYADLQRSLWDADLATNLSQGSLIAADLAPSLWRADLQP